MCGWGAGGESGPGAGLAWGDVEARPGASDQEGGCRGSALAGQGLSLWPWVEAGGRGGQQPHIEPGWWPEGSDFRGKRVSQNEGDSPQGLELLRRRLREGLLGIRPILLSGVSSALLGIDPPRPLVDSLIEN